MLGIHSKLKSDEKSFAKFIELSSKENFKQKLERAKNPKSKDAEDVMNNFFPALVSAGKKTMHRSLEQIRSKCDILSIELKEVNKRAS